MLLLPHVQMPYLLPSHEALIDQFINGLKSEALQLACRRKAPTTIDRAYDLCEKELSILIDHERNRHNPSTSLKRYLRTRRS